MPRQRMQQTPNGTMLLMNEDETAAGAGNAAAAEDEATRPSKARELPWAELKTPRVSITSTFEIAAEHSLPWHTGKCHRRHGHNYVIRCQRSGPVKQGQGPDSGMVQDYSDFDAAIKEVLRELDHYSLNDDAGLVNPTAEHLAMWLLEHLPEVERVEVRETGKHSAIAERIPNDVQLAADFMRMWKALNWHGDKTAVVRDVMRILMDQDTVFGRSAALKYEAQQPEEWAGRVGADDGETNNGGGR